MPTNKTSSSQEIKKLDENPTIADIVSIELLTPGADDCFVSNPYKVDKVTIYSLARSYSAGNPFSYEEKKLDPKSLAEYEAARAIACAYVKATGTVTISASQYLVATTHYITITTTDGTVITATASADTTTATDTNFPTWELEGSDSWATADNLATCLNANSKLTATSNGAGVVTITQVDAGEAGNTTIVLTDPDGEGMSKTDFTGGLPTKDQLEEAKRLKIKLDETANKPISYYNELIPVKVLGDENNPAWLSADTDNAFIENVPKDADDNDQFGYFKYNWNPVQTREGDYIVCWTWTPNAAGDSISSFLKFNLEGSTVLTTSIPAHFTNPEKYTTLLDRYLPEVYKSKLSDGDLTPDTLDKFHKAIAQGFTFIEDMANQSVDLMDANSTHESLLNLLSNLFNLRLKSGDPTLWRRQIKTAVPLFKQKGTLKSLKEALSQADMNLKKVTKLWQITSPYTWQESFKVAKDQTQFILEKVALTNSDFASAAGAVTISASQYLVATTHYITITTTDGTVITATASADTTTTTDTNSPTWALEGSDSWTTGDNLATCLNANSKLTATSTHTGVVTITQVYAGEDGNTTIVLTDPDGEGMTKADFTGGVDDPLAATATVTITNYTELNAGDAVNLIATDGTNYDFINGSQSSTSGTWAANTSNNQTAANLAAVINTNNGPSGTMFSASAVGAVVTITQNTSGSNGNTTVALTDSDTAGMTKTNFTGGETDNINLFRRPKSSSSYTELTNDHVTFSTSEGETTMTWVGHLLSSDPITLAEGDFVKVLYEVVNVPSSTKQVTENYIRSLPLADQRDETLQDYPSKNWNVRVIEEDDVLFDVIIPNRHPFHDPIVYGRIRTEFPYSENIYNMEEYNGSLRDSTDPCHLDKYFVDKCQYCQSSKFNLDVEITDLSTDRMNEAESIIEEYTPFHSILHKINVSGGFDELVLSPIENLEAMVRYAFNENILSGGQQMVFFRAMFGGAFTTGTKAVGTVTISGSQYLVATTHYITITTTDGTVITATASADTTTATDTNSPTWALEGSDSWTTGDNLATCLNANSKLTATSTHTGVVTITQATLGAAGNTTIVLTDPDGEGMTKTDFINGTGDSGLSYSGFAKRDMLAFSSTEVTTTTGTGFNDNIIIYAPDIRFDLLPLNTSSNVLKILAPSVNAGNYSITNPDANMANISGISEPLNTAAFTFTLSNDSYSGTAAIEQDDIFTFSDTTINFIEIGVKTDWDDDNDSSYTGTAWKVQITESGFSNGIYTIANILSDGSLVLNDPTEALPKSNSSSLSYNILDDNDNHMSSSANGSLAISRRAKITDSSPSGGATNDIRNVTDIGDYFILSGNEYKIIGFIESQDYQFYISGYTAGDASGQSFNVYKRVVDSETGYVDYRGMKIVTSTNHETGLGIVNGENPPAVVVDDNLFKENFLVLIGTDYYKITGIDGTTINVDGPEQSWKVSGGTSVSYSILKYSKEKISISLDQSQDGETVDKLPYVQPAMWQYLSHDFDFIDRRGNEVISLNTETSTPFAAFAAEALNSATGDQIKEPVSQEENVTFQIEWADDEKDEIEGDNV